VQQTNAHPLHNTRPLLPCVAFSLHRHLFCAFHPGINTTQRLRTRQRCFRENTRKPRPDVRSFTKPPACLHYIAAPSPHQFLHTINQPRSLLSFDENTASKGSSCVARTTPRPAHLAVSQRLQPIIMAGKCTYTRNHPPPLPSCLQPSKRVLTDIRT
jgi:hypothetical protein